ncbi:MAG: isopentenyl phosphate kinase family protein [Candidatus Micrarchaeota archaeon]|nr:isopentenyl phosphate kinase family protein [Candidatus Micrarchaeota archaeon]
MLILKIGGSVITDKTSEYPKPRKKIMKRLASEISVYRNKMVIIHGAGSYGHPIVKRTGIHKGLNGKTVAFAETQRLQNELNVLFTKYLIESGIPAVPYQPSAAAIMNNGQLKKLFVGPLKEMIRLGLVPVLYGVPAVDEKKGCSILSGDEILPYLAKRLKCEKTIHCTDVDGIYTADPKLHPDAKRIEEVNRKNLGEVLETVSGAVTHDVTGGMARKLKEIISSGVEAVFLSGLKPGNLRKALLGQRVGTVVRP